MKAARYQTNAPALLRCILLLCALSLAGLLCLFAVKSASAAPTTPTDFSDTLVTEVGGPTALAFTPDERMLVTTQQGQVRVFQNDALLPAPALSLGSKVCTNSERGLLGIAVDPEFATNEYVYLFYTAKVGSTCDGSRDEVNRVSRFTLSGNTIDANSEVVLVGNMPSPNGNHNAGDLQFGKDGYLYISIGDGGCDYANNSGCAGQNDAARDQHVLTGKILRITRDGGIPETNPFRGTGAVRCNVTGRTNPGNKCQETFASGLRNPFRMAFDPNASETRFFINDVGQNVWEEIDEGKAGADYGWNCREGAHANNTSGPCSPAPQGMVDPIYEYRHGAQVPGTNSSNCNSITGGAFVPDGVWPAEYDGAYLFGDYVCGTIFKLTNTNGTESASDFATGLGSSSAVALTFGPHAGGQSLYYTTYENGGQVRRIDYTGDTNRAPTAVLTADPTSGDTPLTVALDGSGSNDPEGEALTYLWDFGDETTAETETPTTSHTYNADGPYTAKLTVRDASGATSTPATVRVDAGNMGPEPKIEAPTPSALFRVGQNITLTGSATDIEDDGDEDPETAPTLSWEVIQRHNNDHTHPYFSGTGNNLTFTAPPPEDLFATGPGNYLEIKLTATDSQGVSRTVTQELQPKRVNLIFRTKPAGLKLEVNGETITAPTTLISWQDYKLDVFAPDQKDRRGKTLAFGSWSDREAARHEITTPASSTTYTATFKKRR